MNRHPKGARRREQTIRVWTFAQLKPALPYIAAIMRSGREAKLDSNRWHLAAKKLSQRPGRPDRSTLISQEEAVGEGRRADDRFREAVRELQALAVYCLDSLQGLAVVPFLQDGQLAWFLFDLFDSQPLRFWRYHTDPLETRRPIAEVEDGSTSTSQVV